MNASSSMAIGRMTRYGQLISNDRDSYCDDAQFGVKPPHIARVTRDHRMPRSLCADDNVRIGNVRRSAARKQCADSLSIPSIQRYDLGAVPLDQTPETHLPCRITNDLRERRSRNDDSVPIFEGCRNQRKDPAVAALQRDQTAGVESNTVHAIFRALDPLFGDVSIFRAQARSLAVSGPPVAARPSAIMARNSASFSSDFCTAR